MRRAAPTLIILGLVAAAFGGCSGGDDNDRQDYVDALVEASNDAENGTLSDDEETCFAEAIVDAVGVDRLADAVSPDEIRDRATTNLVELGVDVDQADGEDYYQRASQCADLRTLLVTSQLGTEAISDAATQCFDQRLTDELVQEFFVSGFSQTRDQLADSDVVSQLQAVFAECSSA